VFLLAARDPAAPAADLWSLSARLAIRNLFVTGPLFLAEIAVVTAHPDRPGATAPRAAPLAAARS
jgi:hypothetical protein